MPSTRQQIGSRLRSLRKRLGMSRNSLAQAFQIPEITIKSWETGNVEIRANNLEKYRRKFVEIGYDVSTEWITSCDGPSPFTEKKTNIFIPKQSKLGATSIEHLLELLKTTSNLLYYLDHNQQIIYLNSSLKLYLGNKGNTVETDTKLQDICSPYIYEILHKHFISCQNGLKQRFSYTISNSATKHQTSVDMLYWPLLKNKTNKVLGVLGFIENNTSSLVTI